MGIFFISPGDLYSMSVLLLFTKLLPVWTVTNRSGPITCPTQRTKYHESEFGDVKRRGVRGTFRYPNVVRPDPTRQTRTSEVLRYWNGVLDPGELIRDVRKTCGTTTRIK